MLVVWTGVDATPLREFVGPIISQYQIKHRIEPDMTKYPGGGAGDVILACGSRALAILQTMGLVPKNRTITSLREKPIKHLGVTILVSFDSSLAYMDYTRLPEIQWDVQLAIRIHETGSPAPTIGNYRYVDSLQDVIAYVWKTYTQTNSPVPMACDLETQSLNAYDPDKWIIAASFTVREGYSDVLYFEKGEAPIAPPPWLAPHEMSYWEGLWSQINWLLTTPMVSLRGANFKYDSRWIGIKWGIECSNQKFDTMLVGSLLDENRSNSLKLHAKQMTSMGGYEDTMDKYDMGNLQAVPKAELLNYVGGDTDATFRVAVKMRADLLRDRALSNFYVKLVQPSAKVFEKMERTGVLVDKEYYLALKDELAIEINSLRGKILDCLPNKLRIKHMDSIATAMEEDKFPLKAAVLKEFLFSPAGLNLKPQVFTDKTKEPSTSMDHLMMFEGDPVAAKFISLFREHGSATKTQSTFVVGFLKHLHQDGRFHPSYMLHRGDYGDSDSGTTTGRTSAKDPAIQTLTKHSKWAKKLRKAYIPPPGYAILQLDFSQGELRITACVADEPTMIQTYASGIDLHAVTAAKLNGYTYEDFMLLPDDLRDSLRSGGKAGNFGLIYGMQFKGYREYAYTTYGVEMTEDEAYQQREAFFDLYGRLLAWHETYKDMAHKHKMVRSPLGRIRHLPLIKSKDYGIVAQCERQAINSPIQSCLSDMMQLAMVHIDRQYGDCDIHMSMMCHDSLVLYVPQDDVELWARRVKCVMETLPLEEDFGWSPQLKFLADAEVGYNNFGELKKLKNL